MILISGCLAGITCKYNGEDNRDQRVVDLLMAGKALPVCPEVLGGLSVPRPPCELKVKQDGRLKVTGSDGKDVTAEFELGARKTLAVCQAAGITEAILQKRSPSCGKGKIYDGTFTGRLVDGNGITVQLLLDNGMHVYTTDDYFKHQNTSNN